jgi:hypothetical protein
MIGASDVGSVQPLVKEGDMVTKVRVRCEFAWTHGPPLMYSG